MTDQTKCPQCGGAPGGFDRCDPPEPYVCSKCEGGTMTSTETKRQKLQSKLMAIQKAPLPRSVILDIMADVDELVKAAGCGTDCQRKTEGE